jgi:hypothetical protein
VDHFSVTSSLSSSSEENFPQNEVDQLLVQDVISRSVKSGSEKSKLSLIKKLGGNIKAGMLYFGKSVWGAITSIGSNLQMTFAEGFQSTEGFTQYPKIAPGRVGMKPTLTDQQKFIQHGLNSGQSTHKYSQKRRMPIVQIPNTDLEVELPDWNHIQKKKHYFNPKELNLQATMKPGEDHVSITHRFYEEMINSPNVKVTSGYLGVQRATKTKIYDNVFQRIFLNDPITRKIIILKDCKDGEDLARLTNSGRDGTPLKVADGGPKIHLKPVSAYILDPDQQKDFDNSGNLQLESVHLDIK